MNCQHSSFYQRPTEVVARDLVGKKLVRIIGKNRMLLRLAGIIVETEAYGYSDDPASHAYNGATSRNKAMFGDVGRAYIYFTYGNHFCLNISARTTNVDAGAVLIRGIEPVEGIELMRQLRPVDDVLSLTSGPGKLTQALGIEMHQDGHDLTREPLTIRWGEAPDGEIVSTTRIGISRGTELPYRYLILEDTNVSVPPKTITGRGLERTELTS